MITLHTRLVLDNAQQDKTKQDKARIDKAGIDEALSAYAELFNRVSHHLAADMVRLRRSGPAFKNDYLRRFDITARQFNAVCQYVEGLASNRVENLKNTENTLSDKVSTTQKLITKIEKQIQKHLQNQKKLNPLIGAVPMVPQGAAVVPQEAAVQKLEFRLHQKKRKLGFLLERQSKVIAELHKPYASGLCFGGRKLFHSQFHLEENGYASHDEWLTDWKASRSSQFFVLGSKDETAGCQGCVARVLEDGSFMLDLRLPCGSRITLGPVRFPYQEDKLRDAIGLHSKSKKDLPKVTAVSKTGKSYSRIQYPDDLSALSWRFQRDKKGWRVMVSFKEPQSVITTNSRLGVIGVDLNADHLAWADLDRFGNPVETGSIPCVTYGKTTEAANAIIDAAAIVVSQHAKQAGKPLVLEKLDFSRKKGQLTEDNSPRYARMLSSLSYKKIHTAIRARAAKDGVSVRMVNPAYTSVLGRLHWADRYGLTVHEGAAVAIGRRELRLREVPAHCLVDGDKTFKAPDGRNGHVTLVAPVRKRSKHVWSYLSRINLKLKAALAAQRMARKLDPTDHGVSKGAAVRKHACGTSAAFCSTKDITASVVAAAGQPYTLAGETPARESPTTSFG
jgi:IS605 OrfB family transposase